MFMSRTRSGNLFRTSDARHAIFPQELAAPLRACMRRRHALAMPLDHLVSAIFRLAQVPQLRRDGRLAVTRDRPQLAKRQPRVAIRRGQHHIANDFTLRTYPPRFIFSAPRRTALSHSQRKLCEPCRTERGATRVALAPGAAGMPHRCGLYFYAQRFRRSVLVL